MKSYNKNNLDDAWSFTLADICLTLLIVVVITVVSVPTINSFSSTVIEKEPAEDIFWKFVIIGSDVYIRITPDQNKKVNINDITSYIVHIQTKGKKQFNSCLQVQIEIDNNSSGVTTANLEKNISIASKKLNYPRSPYISKIILPNDSLTP